MNLARIFLRLIGAMTLGFGVLYVLAPAGMVDAAGFGAILPSGMTDVRATYGGLQIGMGAYLLWAAADPARIGGGLLLVLFSIGAVAAGRSLGMMLDGESSSFHVAGLVTETVITILTMIVWIRLPDGEAPQPSA